MLSNDYENGGIYRALLISHKDEDNEEPEVRIYIPGYHSGSIIDSNNTLLYEFDKIKNMLAEPTYCAPNKNVLSFKEVHPCWVTFENGDLKHPVVVGFLGNGMLTGVPGGSGNPSSGSPTGDDETNNTKNPDGTKVPDDGQAKTTASDLILEFIKSFESLHLTSYWDVDAYSIGYGHHNNSIYEGQTCTKEQADIWFKEDIARYEGYVNTYVTNFTLTQQRFDALVSFAYNCGLGNLQKLVRDGRSADEVWDSMGYYVNAGTAEEAGLRKRRQAEQNIFKNGIYVNNK